MKKYISLLLKRRLVPVAKVRSLTLTDLVQQFETILSGCQDMINFLFLKCPRVSFLPPVCTAAIK